VVFAILSAWICSAACSRDAVEGMLARRSLQQRVHALILDPKCIDKVAMEWPPSFPIPVDGPPAGYLVYFYPVNNLQKIPQAYSPAVVAKIPLAGINNAFSCEPTKSPPTKVGPTVTKQVTGMYYKDLDLSESAFYVLTEQVSKAYRARESSSQAKD